MQQRGIAPLDATRGRQFYPIVWSLEALAVASLAGPPLPEEIAAMHAANERFAQALAAGDHPGLPRMPREG